MTPDASPTRVAPYPAPPSFVESAANRSQEWNGQAHRDRCVRLASAHGLLKVTMRGQWPDVRLYASGHGENGWEPVVDSFGVPTGEIVIHSRRGAVECLGVVTGEPPFPVAP